ncbi:MAG: hypothetical protein IT553_09160 [Sphingomonadaceae bacterium]|nr:hypothetical protein [Sphingomonadaceae bacterium]
MDDWQHWVGRVEERHDILTPSLIARHRATFDAGGGEHPLPSIHWCLCTPDAQMGDLGADGHPRRDLDGSFLPPIALPRRMWAASKLDILAPMTAGAQIRRTSTIMSISEKNGATGPLAFVDVAHDSYADDVLAVREVQTLVYRAANQAAPPFLAPRAGVASLSDADWPHQILVVPGAAQLFRYSALSFNSHRIHYDLPYARDAEGYAGLVVHGPLMASLLLHFVTECFGPVSHFAFRAQSPAFCDEKLTLAAKDAGDAIMLAAFAPDGAMTVRAEARRA